LCVCCFTIKRRRIELWSNTPAIHRLGFDVYRLTQSRFARLVSLVSLAWSRWSRLVTFGPVWSAGAITASAIAIAVSAIASAQTVARAERVAARAEDVSKVPAQVSETGKDIVWDGADVFTQADAAVDVLSKVAPTKDHIAAVGKRGALAGAAVAAPITIASVVVVVVVVSAPAPRTVDVAAAVARPVVVVPRVMVHQLVPSSLVSARCTPCPPCNTHRPSRRRKRSTCAVSTRSPVDFACVLDRVSRGRVHGHGGRWGKHPCLSSLHGRV